MAIPVVPGITHTFLVDDLGVTDPSCVGIVDIAGASLLNLRTMNPESQITTLNGRLIGTRVDLTRFSFFDYTMRRKAETLQYRKNQAPLSKKQQYASVSHTKNGSFYYSSRDVTQNLVNRLNCPNLNDIVRPPTNSGINDYKYPGYYYDVNVPYFPKL